MLVIDRFSGPHLVDESSGYGSFSGAAGYVSVCQQSQSYIRLVEWEIKAIKIAGWCNTAFTSWVNRPAIHHKKLSVVVVNRRLCCSFAFLPNKSRQRT